MRIRVVRIGVIAISLVLTALVAVIGINTTRWLGDTFPGFFIISNRVVASISLPDWSEGEPSRFFQHQVVAVDGLAVRRAAAIYEHVRQQPPGTPIQYTFRSATGERVTAVVPSRRFSGTDHLLLFTAYLLTGIFFAGAGLLVAFLKPKGAASLGLLAAGVVTGLFVITAADLYGPHWFVRLHVIAETFVAPAFFHLALVFPTERLRRYRRRLLFAIYAPFVALAVVYEIVLDTPAAYTTAHLVASAAHGVAAVVIIAAALRDLVTSRSPLVRRRVGVVALGTTAAFVIPGVTMAASAALGGRVPVNAGVLTGFFFPLSLGYAIVKQNLFEIDLLLRRATTYVMVVLVIAGMYFVGLSGLGHLMPRTAVAGSPFTFAVLNLLLVFGIAPIQARIRNSVDHVFFRKGYDADQVLSDLSHTLVAAHTFPEVIAETDRILMGAMYPVSIALFFWRGDGVLQPGGQGQACARDLTLPSGLASRIERGEILARYEWDDGSGRSIPAVFHDMSADLLVPIGRGDGPIAVLGIGPKQSGHSYNMHDVGLLQAAASQVALAMTNAGAFAQLEELNASLEAQVRDRTAALETANGDLKRSYEEVRIAYQQLENSQESLMRSDRLATLGRLTASIAHEVNTPLGAALSSLSVLKNLAQEYGESIDDPSVTPEDHRQIAKELRQEVTATTQFTNKAATFIAKVKLHGRETGRGADEVFALKSLVAEVEALLAHRLRASCCQLGFTEDGEVQLVGQPMRLGQVLTNLVSNTVDAYEDADILDGRIEIHARTANGRVVVTVRDWAGGIPPDVLPRIFDELFTTKEPGRGTGLGLCIARNLVEQMFGGTLEVEAEAGVGTCFTITLPMKGSTEVSVAVL